MKPVVVKNITLLFDTSQTVDHNLIDSMIDAINNVLGEILVVSQPHIIKQDDTSIHVIDLKEFED